LQELDNKKAAIDARIEETLSSLKNNTLTTVEHALDKAEAKVSADKESMATNLMVKLANLTAMKATMEDGAAALKVGGDAKFWKLMNKTEGLEAAKKGALAAITNKTMAHMDVNGEAMAALKLEREKASDERKEEMDKSMGEMAKEAGEKAQVAAEKLANLTTLVGDGLDMKAAAASAKLNASAAAAEEKVAAFDGWKDKMLNVSSAKHAALEDKLNSTLAMKDETQKAQAEAMEAKAKALTDGLMDLEKAKDGSQVRVVEGDAAAADKAAYDAGALATKIANVTSAVEGKLQAAGEGVEAMKQGRAVAMKV
jgi:hypothetical protein